MSRRPVALLAAGLLAAGLLAACGTSTGSPSPGTGGGPNGSGTPAVPETSAGSPTSPSGTGSGGTSSGGTGSGGSPTSSARTDPLYPLTVTRSGGVAGFNDSLTVEADGRTTVTSKGAAAAGSCTIGPGALAELAKHVRTLAKPPSTRVATPDHIRADQVVIRLMSPGLTGVVRLPDPPTGDAGQFINSLVADVTGAKPAYRICEPP
ncbi:MAG: hypothetical protein ACR2JN_05960 [Lapillicoccus sp.]